MAAIAVLGAVVVVPLVLYGAGVLLPDYGNDLHRLPLAEVPSGAHDPKDLWRQHGWVQLAGLSSLALLPITALTGVGVGGLALLLLWRRTARQRIPKSLALLPVIAASVASLLFLLSDLGGALMAWRLD